MLDGTLSGEEILEGDTLFVFQLFQEGINGDDTSQQTTDLKAHVIIGNGTVDYVVFVNLLPSIVGPVRQNEVGPFL